MNTVTGVFSRKVTNIKQLNVTVISKKHSVADFQVQPFNGNAHIENGCSMMNLKRLLETKSQCSYNKSKNSDRSQRKCYANLNIISPTIKNFSSKNENFSDNQEYNGKVRFCDFGALDSAVEKEKNKTLSQVMRRQQRKCQLNKFYTWLNNNNNNKIYNVPRYARYKASNQIISFYSDFRTSARSFITFQPVCFFSTNRIIKDNCKITSSQDGSKHEKSLTKKEKLKAAVKEYGKIVIVLHISISLLSLGCCYIAVTSGLDMAAILKYWGASEGATAAGTAAPFVVAYAVHKLLAPFRIALSLGLIPVVVKMQRKFEFKKKSK